MASSWDSEGSRMTLLKNQAAIMVALQELVADDEIRDLLGKRIKATYTYVAEKQRTYGSR